MLDAVSSPPLTTADVAAFFEMLLGLAAEGVPPRLSLTGAELPSEEQVVPLYLEDPGAKLSGRSINAAADLDAATWEDVLERCAASADVLAAMRDDTASRAWLMRLLAQDARTSADKAGLAVSGVALDVDRGQDSAFAERSADTGQGNGVQQGGVEKVRKHWMQPLAFVTFSCSSSASLMLSSPPHTICGRIVPPLVPHKSDSCSVVFRWHGQAGDLSEAMIGAEFETYLLKMF